MNNLETAITAARAAGNRLRVLQSVPNLTCAEKESHFSLVTEADLAAERIIVEIIRQEFPTHSILSEESTSPIDSEWIWVIDPLDGTSGYLRGFRDFSVSIALFHRQQPVLGVVYSPALDELFYARRGHGAFLNQREIRGSNLENLRRSVVTLSHSDLRVLALNAPFSRIYMEVNLVRLLNSCALELAGVACGRSDGLIQVDQSVWDIAAGGLILQEAGGQMLNFLGLPLVFHPDANQRHHVVATNGKLDTHLLKFLPAKIQSEF